MFPYRPPEDLRCRSPFVPSALSSRLRGEPANTVRDPLSMESAMRLNRFVAVTAALLALPSAAGAQTSVRYHVVKLAEIPAPSGCVSTAINDQGDVVGYC